MAADVMTDAKGAAITVGATVKLVGVVTALNPLSNRFHDVSITLSHPLAGATFGPPKDASTSYMEGAEMNPPGYRLKIDVPPGVLVVGS
jgi:hypothetical protein